MKDIDYEALIEMDRSSLWFSSAVDLGSTLVTVMLSPMTIPDTCGLHTDWYQEIAHQGLNPRAIRSYCVEDRHGSSCDGSSS